ncbi:hypothetical protein [Rhodoblastus sp.]|uniref:hypothetical protein n=1 Tax=Rhodoblastus sp. TaxID=1962975 RepID=UPI003F9C6AAB
MTTSIEKSLSRLAGKIESIETRLDAIQRAIPSASAFSNICDHHVDDMIAAAGLDNLTGVASRLRALHEGVDSANSPEGKNPFGKPAVAPVVIDGEFTETKGE